MKTGNLFSDKRAGAYINLANAALSLVAAIAYAVAASGANNFNGAVLLYMLLAALSCAVYFFTDIIWTDIANLIAVIFITLAIGNFAINSINTFADVLNGISMFGSSGGIGYIIALLSLMAVILVLEIVSCFMGRKKQEQWA